MKFSSEQLTHIAEKLRGLPPVERAKRHTKQSAVRVLAAEITALRERGYSLDQVAEALSGAGLDITTATLKNYLRRARARRGERRPKPSAARDGALPSKRDGSNSTARKASGFPTTPDTDDI